MYVVEVAETDEEATSRRVEEECRRAFTSAATAPALMEARPARLMPRWPAVIAGLLVADCQAYARLAVPRTTAE